MSNLLGADLLGANGIVQSQLDEARGKAARLPPRLSGQGRRCRHLTICGNSRCVDGRPRTKSGSLESAPETRLTRECVPPLRQVAQRIVTTSAELFCEHANCGCQVQSLPLRQAFGQRRRGHCVVDVA